MRKHRLPFLGIVTMKVPSQPQTMVRIDPSVGAHRLMGFGTEKCASEGDLKVVLNNVDTMFQATKLQRDIENLNAV